MHHSLPLDLSTYLELQKNCRAVEPLSQTTPLWEFLLLIVYMARNLLYEKTFTDSMQGNFRDLLDKTGMAGGGRPSFLPRPSDLYTVYALDGCPHSEHAVRKVRARGLRHKAYYMDKDLGLTKRELRDTLLRHTDMRNSHKTWPVVFKEGKFVGGNDSF